MFLDRPEKFLRLLERERVALVGRAHVARVAEEGAGRTRRCDVQGDREGRAAAVPRTDRHLLTHLASRLTPHAFRPTLRAHDPRRAVAAAGRRPRLHGPGLPARAAGSVHPRRLGQHRGQHAAARGGCGPRPLAGRDAGAGPAGHRGDLRPRLARGRARPGPLPRRRAPPAPGRSRRRVRLPVIPPSPLRPSAPPLAGARGGLDLRPSPDPDRVGGLRRAACRGALVAPVPGHPAPSRPGRGVLARVARNGRLGRRRPRLDGGNGREDHRHHRARRLPSRPGDRGARRRARRRTAAAACSPVPAAGRSASRARGGQRGDAPPLLRGQPRRWRGLLGHTARRRLLFPDPAARALALPPPARLARRAGPRSDVRPEHQRGRGGPGSGRRYRGTPRGRRMALAPRRARRWSPPRRAAGGVRHPLLVRGPLPDLLVRARGRPGRGAPGLPRLPRSLPGRGGRGRRAPAPPASCPARRPRRWSARRPGARRPRARAGLPRPGLELLRAPVAELGGGIPGQPPVLDQPGARAAAAGRPRRSRGGLHAGLDGGAPAGAGSEPGPQPFLPARRERPGRRGAGSRPARARARARRAIPACQLGRGARQARPQRRGARGGPPGRRGRAWKPPHAQPPRPGTDRERRLARCPLRVRGRRGPRPRQPPSTRSRRGSPSPGSTAATMPARPSAGPPAAPAPAPSPSTPPGAPARSAAPSRPPDDHRSPPRSAAARPGSASPRRRAGARPLRLLGVRVGALALPGAGGGHPRAAGGTPRGAGHPHRLGQVDGGELPPLPVHGAR